MMDVSELRDRLGGAVLEPDDGGYEDARSIFNPMIAKRPAAIAQCESPDDVAAALRFARDAGLEVSIRSGGHSVTGASLTEGGVEVDLRRMNGVSVDPEGRTATVAGGATWADFDRATQPHNLVATGGRVSTTGVAGLTLGGGSGWLERKFGFACDNLEAVTLVTADGRTVTATESENSELFWALHGGGGNFGVAVELVFRLHPLPAASFALLVWPPEAGPELAHRYRELFENGAPPELGGALAYITGPPEEFVPDHLQGALVAGVVAVHAGAEPEMREILAPILELDPEGELIAEMPYAEIQSAIDDPPGYRNYWSAEHLQSFPDEAIEIFCRRAHDMVVPSPSQHILFPWRAAVAEAAEEWPLPHRAAAWVAHPLGLWTDAADDARARDWARGTCSDLRPYSTGSVYLNFESESEDRVERGFGRANYERLAGVKAEFDPDNVFHLHHNIRPLQPA
jgi:FAD/FMN-containing dehydrogenase